MLVLRNVARLGVATVGALALAGVGGCSRNRDAASNGERPTSIASAAMLRKGAVCPIETVNGASARGQRPVRPGSDLQFSGWSTVADRDAPTPPLVHVVLRSAAIGTPDHFLPANRTRRPDIANGDARLLASGFQVRGKAPAQRGEYAVLVWVGDQQQQIECNTGVVIAVR